jgi:hypothetical protein
MKKIAGLAVTAAASLALVACGKSDKASEAAQADNVEMPAEEAVNAVEDDATPVAADSAATDAAAPAATDAAGKAAEDATKAAEKKM